MTKIITTANAPAPVGPYSQAVRAGSFLFCSGQIAIDPKTGELISGTVVEHTEQILKNIEAVLNAAAADFSKVVKTTIYLTDMKDFQIVNEIYGKRFPTSPPARSTVAVHQLPKGVPVEIEVLAFLD